MFQDVPASSRCLGRSACNMFKVSQSNNRPDVPRRFQEVKVPKLRDNDTGWWEDSQPYASQDFTPRKSSWYSFLLEAVSTPGP